MSNMELCHKFQRCSSPTCPLDEEGHLRVRLSGEPKCSLSSNERRNIKRQKAFKD